MGSSKEKKEDAFTDITTRALGALFLICIKILSVYCIALCTFIITHIILFLPFILLLIARSIDSRINTKRSSYLGEQERYFRGRIRMTNLKRYPAGRCRDAAFVSGSVVLANNYFVSLTAWFRHIFGGELPDYSALCNHARRMALVRMMQEAESLGANVIYNVRFETVSIISASNPRQGGGVELIAYGTAVKELESAG